MSQTSYEIARRRVASFLCEQFGLVNQWRGRLEDMVIAAIDEALATDSPVSQEKMSESEPEGDIDRPDDDYREWLGEDLDSIRQLNSFVVDGEGGYRAISAAEAMASQEGMGQS